MAAMINSTATFTTTTSDAPIIPLVSKQMLWKPVSDLVREKGEGAVRPLSLLRQHDEAPIFYPVHILTTCAATLCSRREPTELTDSEDPENPETRVSRVLMKFRNPTITYPYGGDRAIGHTYFPQEYKDTAFVLRSLTGRQDRDDLDFFLKYHHCEQYTSSILVDHFEGYQPLDEFLKTSQCFPDWGYIRIQFYRALGRVMSQIQKCRLTGEMRLSRFVINPITYSIKMIDYSELGYCGNYTEEELREERIKIRFLQEAQMGNLISDLFLYVTPDIDRKQWFDFKRSYFRTRFPDYYEETPEAIAKYGHRFVGKFERFLYQALFTEIFEGMGEFSEKMTGPEQLLLIKFILFRHDVDLYFTVPGSI